MKVRAWHAACLAAVGAGCGVELSDLASFLDDDFGDISDNVLDLEGDDLEQVMATLMLRFRTYHFELRENLPIDDLFSGTCVIDQTNSGTAFRFVVDVNCLEGDRFAPAEGLVTITQRQVAAEPVAVFVVDVVYDLVTVGERPVDGLEKITITDDPNGANVTDVDFVLDGRDFDYQFRDGFIDGETPVIDYRIPGPDGEVFARITNPTSIGGFVSVFLTGLDGTLACEVRDALWTPDRLPRGSCDNGVVFGLPD